MADSRRLRSAGWFGARDLAGFIHRSSLHLDEGAARAAAAGKPVVGICNSWSELVTCNLHLRALAEAARRGIVAAGGVPLEFPTISLGENLMKPTAMMFRNLMAMDVEECLRAYPLDAVVLLGGCDKTVPAQLMGALSADLPAIMVTAGPAEPNVFRRKRLSSGTDIWHYVEELRAGRMTEQEFDDLEAAAVHAPGHCNELGTASTLAALVEAMGLCLPRTASVGALSPARVAAAEASGARAVALAREGPRPRELVTTEALDNAITVLMALGGGTNAVVHLLALAGRAGVPLSLDRFDEISRRTPVIANLQPAGEYLFEDLERAGGVRAVLRELSDLLHLDAPTVSGRTLGEEIADARVLDDTVIGRRADEGGLTVLRGSLAPSGAILKHSAATPSLLRHRGPAIVFEDVWDVAARIDEVDATPESVLVLRNSGPRGGPGMPEWGQLPVPRRLLERGVTDVVRISDARMSGTAFGTVVLHVAPESAAGGPLAIVQDGDPIVLDADARRLELDLPGAEIERRLSSWTPPAPAYRRGYGALYLAHVLQADEGCDFDFLRALPGEEPDREPLGLLSGWIGGW